MQHQDANAKLTEKVDRIIAELVIEKRHLIKAYNYYNGILDSRQFKYLEDNFGIGNPTSIEFIPLIKKHVDALVGEYLETPILATVSCKDKATISKMSKERQHKVGKAL